VDVAGDVDLDAEGLRRMHELKTGRLIGASVAVAPILLEAPEAAQLALGRLASELGVLFQIVDDILDVTGSEEQTGKTSGTDERLGKRTYVSVFGLDQARALAGGSHERARVALDSAREVLSGDARDLELLTDFMYRRDA
jgi:geranylgeranyl diphosphate synthase type II